MEINLHIGWTKEWRKMGAIGECESIEIVLNGRALSTAAGTLEALVGVQGLTDKKVATAVNGHFVPAGRRATTRLAAGDRVEIVSPRQGG